MRAWTSSRAGRADRHRSIRSQTRRLMARLRRFIDPAARYAMREGMELAMLRAIQELPGRQRAVLILRDVLGWSASEVAELLESTIASANSALQRARGTIDQHLVEATRPATGSAERELLNRYVAAFEHADMDGLVALLHEDATLRMPPQPSLSGGLRIARFFLETVAHGDLTRIRHKPAWANRRPAVTIEVRGEDGTWIPTGSVCSRSRTTRSWRSTRFLICAAPAVRAHGRTLGAAARRTCRS